MFLNLYLFNLKSISLFSFFPRKNIQLHTDLFGFSFSLYSHASSTNTKTFYMYYYRTTASLAWVWLPPGPARASRPFISSPKSSTGPAAKTLNMCRATTHKSKLKTKFWSEKVMSHVLVNTKPFLHFIFFYLRYSWISICTLFT